MSECSFCRIIRGDLPAHVLYEDATTLAFLDANPAVEGHTLVVPNEHVEELFVPTHPASESVFQTVATVARSLDRILSPDGFSTFYTTGTLVGQVDHAHAHLLPRRADDEIGFALSRRPLDDEAGERLARRIREDL